MKMKRAFTLMEVNLAVFIMATGVLAMVSLYPLGFRENEQSVEDVAGAALADEFLNPIVAALSSTNITWQAWKGLCDGGSLPKKGWESYYVGESFRNPPASASGIRSKAQSVVSAIAGVANSGNGGGDCCNKEVP